jgi:hypothetical protein
VFFDEEVLTPKIGIGERLTCGPSLVKKHHSVGTFSSKDSVKVPAVGSAPSFGRRAVCAWKKERSGIHDDVA